MCDVQIDIDPVGRVRKALQACPDFLESIAPMFPRDAEERERDAVADHLANQVFSILDAEPSISGDVAGAAGYAAALAYRLLSLGVDADICIRDGVVSVREVAS